MHNPLYKEFGNRLAELRKLKGFTQTEIALKLNTVQSTYSGYELGTRKITLELIKELSKIFDVSPDFLILGKEINPTYSSDQNKQLDLTCEEMQVTLAYRKADLKDKNTARHALALPLLPESADLSDKTSSASDKQTPPISERVAEAEEEYIKSRSGGARKTASSASSTTDGKNEKAV